MRFCASSDLLPPSVLQDGDDDGEIVVQGEDWPEVPVLDIDEGRETMLCGKYLEYARVNLAKPEKKFRKHAKNFLQGAEVRLPRRACAPPLRVRTPPECARPAPVSRLLLLLHATLQLRPADARLAPATWA